MKPSSVVRLREVVLLGTEHGVEQRRAAVEGVVLLRLAATDVVDRIELRDSPSRALSSISSSPLPDPSSRLRDARRDRPPSPAAPARSRRRCSWPAAASIARATSSSTAESSASVGALALDSQPCQGSAKGVTWTSPSSAVKPARSESSSKPSPVTPTTPRNTLAWSAPASLATRKRVPFTLTTISGVRTRNSSPATRFTTSNSDSPRSSSTSCTGPAAERPAPTRSSDCS